MMWKTYYNELFNDAIIPKPRRICQIVSAMLDMFTDAKLNMSLFFFSSVPSYATYHLF